jgi:hypothetical protein
MVSVLASSVVDRQLEPRSPSGQTKDFKIPLTYVHDRGDNTPKHMYMIQETIPLTYVHDRGEMVSVLASSVVDRQLEPRSPSGQTKDFKIDICCFSAKHAAVRRKSKDWVARNQDNVSEWDDMFTRRLLLQ